MNVFPVITREVRAQARQPFTHWLRMIGVAALLVTGFLFTFQAAVTRNPGSTMFGYLHLALLCTIWILVPFSAADCLSRERREGTLGLLFLTPLKPPDIVIAKGISHGLRGMTLLIAVLPVLTIPFLLGGASWQQAVVSAAINFSSVCLALAAAIVASALTRRGGRALAGAMLLAACAFVVYAYLVGLTVGWNIAARWRTDYSNVELNVMLGATIVGLNGRMWANILTVLTPGQIVNGVVEAALASILILSLAVMFAARLIRRSWHEEPPSARAQKIDRIFFQPVVGVSFLKRWMRWKLERNPIGWLEQRRWSGRMITWAWFAIIISVQSAAVTDRSFFQSYNTWELTLAWALAVSMAASAAGSLRRERETGVLELLLVSPLKTEQIIGGRLRGLWGQFLPSIVALLGIWIFLAGFLQPRVSPQIFWFFLTTYLVLPVIGLYFSVRCRHFISAFLLTLGVAIALPVFVVGAVRTGWWLFVGSYGDRGSYLFDDWSGGLGFVQIAFAVILGFRLNRKLAMRSFPLEQGVA